MNLSLGIQNESRFKHLYRRASLEALAKSICIEESLDGAVEISLLLCDDAFIRSLNRRYRNRNAATDVLSFEQQSHAHNGPRVLGDIVISLETAASNCQGDRALMRKELSLLFCHGLLHLLGYDHARPKEKALMNAKQAHYLNISNKAAWAFGPKPVHASPRALIGGSRSLGR